MFSKCSRGTLNQSNKENLAWRRPGKMAHMCTVLVRNWVNTGLPISFRTNDTVIDTCVVLSLYNSMLMAN